MNKVIAVKRIELLPQDDFRAYKEIQAAYNEAYWLANLSHKNVLRSDGINIFVPDADAFILGMELLDGCSLTKPILDGRCLDVSAIACIASQVCYVLYFAALFVANYNLPSFLSYCMAWNTFNTKVLCIGISNPTIYLSATMGS